MGDLCHRVTRHKLKIEAVVIVKQCTSSHSGLAVISLHV
jgi:hypothetical protein